MWSALLYALLYAVLYAVPRSHTVQFYCSTYGNRSPLSVTPGSVTANAGCAALLPVLGKLVYVEGG
jgi:hypothetical protein